jgi:hypothetical protein
MKLQLVDLGRTRDFYQSRCYRSTASEVLMLRSYDVAPLSRPINAW